MSAQRSIFVFSFAFTFIFWTSSLGCAQAQTAPPKPLFERLGGQQALVPVVKEIVNKIDKNEILRPYFAFTFNQPGRKKRFSKMLYFQICEAAGGGCKYPGKPMREAHQNMKIKSNEFEELVNIITETLNQFKVPEPEQQELLAFLAPMKSDVVEGSKE